MDYSDESITQIALNFDGVGKLQFDQGEQWVAKFRGQPFYANNAVTYSTAAKVKSALRHNYAFGYGMAHEMNRINQEQGLPPIPWAEHGEAKNSRKLQDKMIELGIITIERIR